MGEASRDSVLDMARKLRVQYEGAIYHVTLRGVERRMIFTADGERERFLERLGQGVGEYGVRVYLYCLMGNHVHLLLETPQANLSAFMHKLQTAYTVYFNLRHRRKGHLLQGRFGAQPVEGDDYLLRLSRYIHLNPVFVRGMTNAPLEERVAQLRTYSWSSYRGYAGLCKPYEWVDESPLLTLTGASARRRRAAYGGFVEAGLAESDTEFHELLKASRWGIGDRAFQDRIRDIHTDMLGRVRRQEDVSFRRVEATLTADAVLGVVAAAFGQEAVSLRRRQYDCAARAVAARMLGRFAGMNQRDTGAYLGMATGSAVCRQLGRLRDLEAHDPDLAARIGKVAGTLTDASSLGARPQMEIIKG